ncbi:MAG: helix-turn-helix domain-containing protein [Candidatus Omnitrophota bacterium]
MPKKLLTSKELSEYLGIREEDVAVLVDQKVISAYKIGGELLRFQKDQIDATRSEIESCVRKIEKIPFKEKTNRGKEKLKISVLKTKEDTLSDAISDFFYFNDFYIVSGVLILILLVIIFRG